MSLLVSSRAVAAPWLVVGEMVETVLVSLPQVSSAYRELTLSIVGHIYGCCSSQVSAWCLVGILEQYLFSTHAWDPTTRNSLLVYDGVCGAVFFFTVTDTARAKPAPLRGHLG